MSESIIATIMPALDSMPAHTLDERITRVANWLDSREQLINASAKVGCQAAQDIQALMLHLTIPPTLTQIEQLEAAARSFEQVVI